MGLKGLITGKFQDIHYRPRWRNGIDKTRGCRQPHNEEHFREVASKKHD
jgi:hypothetical protein